MKKIQTLASLVAIAAMTMSVSATAFADEPALIVAKPAGKTVKPKPAVAAKKFRYLDMVEHKHPVSIRNAVIVYDFGVRKKKCDASDAQGVSNCLRAPAT